MWGRRPVLPAELEPSWHAFSRCAERIEAGRRLLLGTLPVGRVELAPIAVGIDALREAIADVENWMHEWEGQPYPELWQESCDALHEVLAAMPHVEKVAATTDELEELLEAVNEDLMSPLDVFADVERRFRQAYRIPRELAPA